MTDFLVDTTVVAQALRELPVAVLGPTPLALAHAEVLRASGIDVRVGGQADLIAAERGVAVMELADAVEDASVIVITGDDQEQATIFNDYVADSVVDGDVVIFTRPGPVAFSAVTVSPTMNVALVMPMASAHAMRHEYEQGRGVPTLIAVHGQPNVASGVVWDVVQGYARAIGATRSGCLQTTFQSAAHASWVAAHAVAGGVLALARNGFESLTAGGVDAQLAYWVITQTLESMATEWTAAGPHASVAVGLAADELAVLSGAQRLADGQRAAIEQMSREIQDGTVPRYIAAVAPTSGATALREDAKAHPLDVAGETLRRNVALLRARR